MTNRRQSREIALQALFYREFNKDIEFSECLETFKKNFQAEKDVWSYALKLLLGVEEQTEKLDAQIRSCNAKWSLDRMALVDLLLLRIAIFEMLGSDEGIPPRVAINEALEIAKKYSSKESSSFINGVLDQVIADQNLECT